MVTWSMMIKLARGRRKRIVFVVAFFPLIRSVTWGWEGGGLAIEQLGSRGSIYGNRIGGKKKKWNLTLSLSLHQLQLPFLFVALFCLHFDTNCSHCCKFVSFLFCYSYSAEKKLLFLPPSADVSADWLAAGLSCCVNSSWLWFAAKSLRGSQGGKRRIKEANDDGEKQ